MMYKVAIIENDRVLCMNNGMIDSACGQTSARQVSQMEYMLLQAIMYIKTIILIMVQTIGVGLGEMDNMLLRKVEELTLYMLQQQKIIEKQNDRIQDLEDKIK